MSRQPIKYASTTVTPTKSAGEIQDLVRRYGGTRCEIMWDTHGRVTGVRFAVRHERFGEVPVRLTAKTGRIFEILKAARPRKSYVPTKERERRDAADVEQAYRIAWRQLRDFVEQALLAVETGLFPLHEAFMAAVETEDPQTGESVTWGELLERHGASGPGGLRLLSPAPHIIEAEYAIEDAAHGPKEAGR
jgi:hypothetical protein